MALVNYNQNLLTPIGAIESAEVIKEDSPSFGEAFTASWENDSVFAAGVNILNKPSFVEDSSWDSLSESNLEGYEGHAESFVGIKSQAEQEYIKNKIDGENDNRRIIDQAGWSGVGAGLLAAVVDPISLASMAIPGVGAAKVGASIGRVALGSAAGGFVESAITEGVLQSTQETRTATESIINVTSSALLGGIMGGAISSFTPKAFNELAEKVGNELNLESGVPKHAGAAEVAKPTVDSEGMKYETLVGMTKHISVGAKISTASSPQARRMGADLLENSYYTGKNDNGIATENSVETFTKLDLSVGQATILKSINSNYAKYKQSQPAELLSPSQFRDEVGRATRSGEHLISEVLEASKASRAILDDSKERMIATGMLDKDAEVTTSNFYFPRYTNRKDMLSNEKQVVDLLEAHIQQGADKSHKSNVSTSVKLKRKDIAYEAALDFDTDPKSIKRMSKDSLQAKLKEFEGMDIGYKLNPNMNKSRLTLVKELKDAVKKMGEHRAKKDIKRDRIRLAKEVHGDFDARAQAQATFNKMIGDSDGDVIELPSDVTVKSGRTKERTINIPDEVLDTAGVLINDSEWVMNKYLMDTLPQINITERFGRLDLADQIKDISNEYDGLIEKATKRGKKKLRDEKADIIKSIQGSRDVLINQYTDRSKHPFLEEAGRVIRDFNFVTMLGGMTLSAIPDVGMPILRNGFGASFKGLGKRLKGAVDSSSKEELESMGVGLDSMLNSRMNAMADIDDMASERSGLGKATKAMSNVMGKVTLMNAWNNQAKLLAGEVSKNRVIKGALNGNLKASEVRFLASKGFDDIKLRDIAKEVKKHGDDNIIGIDKWDNQVLARDFKASLVKMVDETIVTPGTGDKPLSMNGNMGKIFFQFKSFTLSATQKIAIAGLQQGDKNVVSGAMTMVALGSLAYVVKEKAAGREPDYSPDNLITQGVERSGVLGIITEAHGVFDKLTGLGMSRLTGVEMSRYKSRGALSSLTGPTLGRLQDVGELGGAIQSGNLEDAGYKGSKFVPFANLFYFQKIVRDVFGKND